MSRLRSALVPLLLLAVAIPALAAGGESGKKSSKMDHAPKATLPATKYLTLIPFVVPLTRTNEITGQYTLAIALEITDPDVREELGRRLPRFRNEVYGFLFQAVTARSSSGQVPGLDFLQARLLKIAQDAAGPVVTSVVIQEAYAGPVPVQPDPRAPDR